MQWGDKVLVGDRVREVEADLADVNETTPAVAGVFGDEQDLVRVGFLDGRDVGGSVGDLGGCDVFSSGLPE